jgi:hypothetical protein
LARVDACRLVLWPLVLLAAVAHGVRHARADGEALPRLVQVTPLPGVGGRIDHLAIDPAGQRLFVAALGNDSLEVVDLASGRRVRSVAGLDEPQGVAFLSDLREVLVANAGGTLVAFVDPSFRRLAAISGLDDADNLRIDVGARRLYVGHGHGALGVIDPVTMKRVADIELPGHPESFQLDKGPLVYVNVPRTSEVVVVDRRKRAIVSRLKLPGVAENYPMALDEEQHRLFVGARRPARLTMLDTRSGRAIADAPCVGDADDVFYDRPRARVYVVGGEGFVDVFDAAAGEPGRLVRIARVATRPGARTGLWSPELRRLFIAAPRRDGQEAAILVFATLPPG